jgi:multiple sugar transport system substrate-binding protein
VVNARKRLQPVPGLTMTAAFVLAACGGNGDASGDRIVLRVMSATVVERPESDAEEAIAEAFMEENPDIEIEFIGTPMNEMYATLTTMATGGEFPDVFTNSPEFYAQAQDLGVVEPLDDLLGEDYIAGFEPATLEQAVLDGELQFAPFFTIPMGLLYRADLFEEAGVEPPTTWSDFIDVAQELTTDDRWGFAMVGSNDGSGGSRFVPTMRTFGARELVEDGDGWATEFDTPEAVEAFEFYGDLVNTYEVVPPGPLQTSYGEAISLMASEQAAMMITGPHSIGAITAQNPDLEGKLAGAPMPSAPGHDPASALGMLGFSISSQSEHKEAAAEYIKFLLEKENQIEWNEVTGRLPVRTEAAEDPARNAE